MIKSHIDRLVNVSFFDLKTLFKIVSTKPNTVHTILFTDPIIDSLIVDDA